VTHAPQAASQHMQARPSYKRTGDTKKGNFMHVLQNFSCMFVTTVTVLSVDLTLYHCCFDDADMKNCPICCVYAAHQGYVASLAAICSLIPGIFIKSYNYL